MILHSSKTTIERYLEIPENEIPVVKENLRERQNMQQMENKKAAIMEVRDLYAKGYAIDGIMRLTGHTVVTIKNYLKDDCPLSNGHYDCRMPGKLAPYEQEVIAMCSKGITYKKIHEHICKKRDTETVAFLRMFMQKERTHQRSFVADSTEPMEYIPRKFFAN